MLTSPSKSAKLLFVVGTRPEAIKLAPLILLARRDPSLRVVVCATGQHRELLDHVFATFAILPDHDLHVMTFDQKPATVAAQVTEAVAAVIERERPDWIVVQGDTVSTFASSLAAFYSRVPVAHVEAGLRTFDPRAPWPEEMNRRLTTQLASLHFAPTDGAREHLLRDGVEPARIEVTGNTIVDAVQLMTANDDPGGDTKSRLVLVTVHRRENLGARVEAVCSALPQIVEAVSDAEVLVIGHLNPTSKASVDNFARAHAEHPRIRVSGPVDYPAFLRLLRRAHVVLTDSGGVQEEAPIFGKPVLVLRDVTERPEILDSSSGLLVGTDSAAIVAACTRLLTDDAHYAAMSRPASPFGDGRASERILARLRSEISIG